MEEKFDPFIPMQKPKKSLEEQLNQVGKIVRENDKRLTLEKELAALKSENERLKSEVVELKEAGHDIIKQLLADKAELIEAIKGVGNGLWFRTYYPNTAQLFDSLLQKHQDK